MHTAIKESFNSAILNPENIDLNGDMIWDWVAADVHMDVYEQFEAGVIDQTLDQLIDEYEEKLQVFLSKGFTLQPL
jgi:hypothetical protein